jgi:hypothetical protein
MHRITKGIVTLAMAGAALTPTLATASPASADQTGLVNVYAENILNGNQVAILQNVSVPVAAALCNINANVLSTQLQNNQRGECPALTRSWQIAWVSD